MDGGEGEPLLKGCDHERGAHVRILEVLHLLLVDLRRWEAFDLALALLAVLWERRVEEYAAFAAAVPLGLGHQKGGCCGLGRPRAPLACALLLGGAVHRGGEELEAGVLLEELVLLVVDLLRELHLDGVFGLVVVSDLGDLDGARPGAVPALCRDAAVVLGDRRGRLAQGAHKALEAAPELALRLLGDVLLVAAGAVERDDLVLGAGRAAEARAAVLAVFADEERLHGIEHLSA